MASLQAGVQAGVGIIAQLPQLEISLGDAAKVALDFLAKNDKEDAPSRQLATVAGDIRNVQPRSLKLEKSHSFFGHFVCPPPQNIAGGADGPFVHRANPANPNTRITGGSKAFVIYGTHDCASTLQLGYLLAFYKSEKTSDVKVYVEAGEVSKLMKQEMCEIERKLDMSSCTSQYKDKDTGATACAKISNDCGCANTASLAACFTVDT